MTLVEKTPEQLQLEDAQRQALEAAAKRLESLVGSRAYCQAFRKAAYEIRKLKP